MAIGVDGDVYAGTFPEGKIFKVDAGQKGGAPRSSPRCPARRTSGRLAFDAQAKALYAATGPEGKVFRIDQTGKAQVYFKSEDAHLVSVAVGDDGTVYAGSNGKALLYKITGPGRATVLYDFDTDDVKAIVVAPPEKGGAVYAVANKYSETFEPRPSATRHGPHPARPAPGASRARQGQLSCASRKDRRGEDDGPRR